MNPIENLRQLINDTLFEHETPITPDEQAALDSLRPRFEKFHGFLPPNVVELPADFVQPPTVLEDLA